MASAAENRRGIAFMLGAVTLFVCNDALMKLARDAYPVGQALALRTVFAFTVTVALVFAAREARHIGKSVRPRVLLRGAFEAGAALTFNWSLGLMPLADATAIGMASPLLIVALAAAMGLERVGWRRVLAISVGFLGVLVVLRPGAGAFSAAALVVLASCFLVACRDISTRFVGDDVPSTIVSLSTITIVGLISAGYGLSEEWHTIWRHETFYVAAAAMLAAIATFCLINANRRADVSVVTQYRYAVIIVATVLGYLVWGHVPDMTAFAGIALIVGSGLYTLHRQRARSNPALKFAEEPSP